MKTFEECHLARMTAQQASKATGKTLYVTYDWARANGKDWAKPQQPVRGIVAKQKVRAAAEAAVKAPQCDGDDSEHHQVGGRFVMVNNKTGQRIKKRSERAAYLHAQLLGWVDWDVEELP